MRFDSELNTPEARMAFYEIREDIKKRNDTYIKLYPDAAIFEGENMLSRVSEAFFRSRCYLNYREHFIVIKVHQPSLSDLVSKEAEELRTLCDERGYTIHRTPNRILVRLPRMVPKH